MSLVRPLAAHDLDQVATLFNRLLRHERKAPSNALRAYFREFYLDGPYREPDIPSLVHVTSDGRITGFIGVHTVPFVIDGRRVRAAFCGALMTEEKDRDPLAGARLLKAFLAGPQDVSMSETASPVSQAMWQKVRGDNLPDFSLDWFRVLRPSGFLLTAASRWLPPLRLFGGLARGADALFSRRTCGESLLGFRPEPAPAAISTQTCSRTEFGDAVRAFSERQAARPDWSHGYLDHVLETAMEKPAFGDPALALVRQKSGAILGGFLYHSKPGGIARVLQLLSEPEHYGLVLDQLFAHAFARGASAVRGRSSSGILKAATRRPMIFTSVSASVIHARDTELVKLFSEGDCFINGLAGESWNRFFGGDLD